MENEHDKFDLLAAAVDIAAAISAGTVSSREITQHYIDRIESLDTTVNAVCVRLFEHALQAAEEADRRQAKGESLGPLHGVPMSIKESYVHANTPATWGIPAYRDNIAVADGLAVARFKAAGAHFLGKTNVPIDLGDFQRVTTKYTAPQITWDTSRLLAVLLVVRGVSRRLYSSRSRFGHWWLHSHAGTLRGCVWSQTHLGHCADAGPRIDVRVPDADLSVCGPLARDPRDLRLALDIMAEPAGRQAVGWQLHLPECTLNDLARIEGGGMGH